MTAGSRTGARASKKHGLLFCCAAAGKPIPEISGRTVTGALLILPGVPAPPGHSGLPEEHPGLSEGHSGRDDGPG